jgi:GT2 family glycosyltransferase
MEVPFYTTPLDWCAFILPKTTFEKVGEFDEGFFPAYFEDNDYAYRMKLMGMGITKIPYLIPSVHRVSQTMEHDDSVRVRFHKNKKRYIEKWGGEPMQEKYKTPFNSK